MPSLLLIEDDPDYADMLGQTLRREGVPVIVALDSRSAVSAADKGDIACITTDSFMFEQEEFPALLKIRELLPEVPLFCISVYRGPLTPASLMDKLRQTVNVSDVFFKREEEYFVPRIKIYFSDIPPEILSENEQRLFRSLVRKEALSTASPEELNILSGLQQKRLERIGSSTRGSTERQQVLRADAFDRAVEALRDYVKTVQG